MLSFTPQMLWVPTAPAVVAAAGVTWNPSDKSSNATLSNGNLTFISGNGFGAGVRATTSHVAGKYYWELTVNADGGGFDVAVTVLTGASSLTAADANNVECFNGNGQIWTAGSLSLSSGHPPITAVGNVIQVALDLDNRLVWFRGSSTTLWDDGGLQDPAAASGGEVVPAGAIFPGAQLNAGSGSAQITANFAGSFINTPPAGFGVW